MTETHAPSRESGKIHRISGPVVTVEGIRPQMYDVVHIGREGLLGEVIKIEGKYSIIQVYEDTSGILPGEPVESTGRPMMVTLGPGLLSKIFDGIQRPLMSIREIAGDYITRGISVPALDMDKQWGFTPAVKIGDVIEPGQVIGTVPETEHITHKVMLPPNAAAGTVKEIRRGSFTLKEPIVILDDGRELTMAHEWPVRIPRPFSKKLLPNIPLITGQRVIDGLFPIARGGTAAIPGPFGSGKTVTQQQLAKWSNAQIVVYIGCGERGNEMTDVLTEFPFLVDPKTGRPLMERTILIANTSNMPVAAREASVYTGITLAEYYRDMGYDVSLMADSTSRWAEAMREISSRLEEMPGEEGYPAYLAARLAEFYERAGRVTTLQKGEGSITVIGAVSPPGGDFNEPVTQNTLRIVRVFWGLDARLAHRRHFPSINWLTSYSLYTNSLAKWYDENISPEWNDLRAWAVALLQKEANLMEIVQLVGSDSLPLDEQLTLEIARMIREIFLQQNAFHSVDSFSPMLMIFKLLKAIRHFMDLATDALTRDITINQIIQTSCRGELAAARFEENPEKRIDAVMISMEKELAGLVAE